MLVEAAFAGEVGYVFIRLFRVGVGGDGDGEELIERGLLESAAFDGQWAALNRKF